jgi:hypothetical protein
MAGPFIVGTAGSGASAYLTDGSGNPIMIKNEQVWGIITMAGSAGGAVTYQTDITNYCSTRAGQGFNAVWTAAPATNNDTDGQSNVNGNTWDNVAPFTSPGVLNNTYWTRVDYLITTAASNNMTVMLNVAAGYTFYNSGGPQSGWTTANWTTFGTNLGNRYKNAANLVWAAGDDYFDDIATQIDAMIAAVKATGDSHMWTFEMYSESTSRYDCYNNTEFATASTYVNFNWVYSYNTGYECVEYAYQEPSPIPACHGDGYYEAAGGARDYMRGLVWWCLSSGSRGFSYANENIWPWAPTSLGVMSSYPFMATDIGNIWAAFGSLKDWNKLVPDTSSALVTAGRGTHSSEFVSGGSGGLYTSGNTYVTASITPGGTLAVIYIPSNVTITVNGSLMQAGYTANWMDPATGTKTAATIASTYNHPGTNSLGGADWVLVLQAPSGTAGTSSLSSTGTISGEATINPVSVLSAVSSISAVVKLLPISSLAGSGSITAHIVQAVVAANLTGTGSSTLLFTETSVATLTAAGSVTSLVTQSAITSLASSATVSSQVTLLSTVSASGLSNLTAAASILCQSTMSGVSNIHAMPAMSGVTLGFTGITGIASVFGIAGFVQVTICSATGNVTATAAILPAVSASGAGTTTSNVIVAVTDVLSASSNINTTAVTSATAIITAVGTLSAIPKSGIPELAVLSGSSGVSAAPVILSSAQLTGSSFISASVYKTTSGTALLRGVSSVITLPRAHKICSRKTFRWRIRYRPVKDRLLPAERWISTDDGGSETRPLPTIPSQDPVTPQPAAAPRRSVGSAQIVPR